MRNTVSLYSRQGTTTSNNRKKKKGLSASRHHRSSSKLKWCMGSVILLIAILCGEGNSAPIYRIALETAQQEFRFDNLDSKTSAASELPNHSSHAEEFSPKYDTPGNKRVSLGEREAEGTVNGIATLDIGRVYNAFNALKGGVSARAEGAIPFVKKAWSFVVDFLLPCIFFIVPCAGYVIQFLRTRLTKRTKRNLKLLIASLVAIGTIAFAISLCGKDCIQTLYKKCSDYFHHVKTIAVKCWTFFKLLVNKFLPLLLPNDFGSFLLGVFLCCGIGIAYMLWTFQKKGVPEEEEPGKPQIENVPVVGTFTGAGRSDPWSQRSPPSPQNQNGEDFASAGRSGPLSRSSPSPQNNQNADESAGARTSGPSNETSPSPSERAGMSRSRQSQLPQRDARFEREASPSMEPQSTARRPQATEAGALGFYIASNITPVTCVAHHDESESMDIDTVQAQAIQSEDARRIPQLSQAGTSPSGVVATTPPVAEIAPQSTDRDSPSRDESEDMEIESGNESQRELQEPQQEEKCCSNIPKTATVNRKTLSAYNRDGMCPKKGMRKDGELAFNCGSKQCQANWYSSERSKKIIPDVNKALKNLLAMVSRLCISLYYVKNGRLDIEIRTSPENANDDEPCGSVTPSQDCSCPTCIPFNLWDRENRFVCAPRMEDLFNQVRGQNQVSPVLEVHLESAQNFIKAFFQCDKGKHSLKEYKPDYKDMAIRYLRFICWDKNTNRQGEIMPHDKICQQVLGGPNGTNWHEYYGKYVNGHFKEADEAAGAGMMDSMSQSSPFPQNNQNGEAFSSAEMRESPRKSSHSPQNNLDEEEPAGAGTSGPSNETSPSPSERSGDDDPGQKTLGKRKKRPKIDPKALKKKPNAETLRKPKKSRPSEAAAGTSSRRSLGINFEDIKANGRKQRIVYPPKTDQFEHCSKNDEEAESPERQLI